MCSVNDPYFRAGQRVDVIAISDGAVSARLLTWSHRCS